MLRYYETFNSDMQWRDLERLEDKIEAVCRFLDCLANSLPDCLDEIRVRLAAMEARLERLGPSEQFVDPGLVEFHQGQAPGG